MVAKTKQMPSNRRNRKLEKSATGVRGLDEITDGGLPKGRPTLVCGGAGAGKTILAMEFLLRGAIEFNEPGVFMSFEEDTRELAENFDSMGYDLDDLVSRKKFALEHVFIERENIEETGEYDLEALFVRLGYAIDSIGAKRVVLDTIEALFSGLSNTSILRAELRRLFRWLKKRKMTAVITAEKGEGALTRHGLEEYVADCVILLDQKVRDQISTRRLRVLKYRGTSHGVDEYPFIIDKKGILVLPITSLGLDHPVSTERISSGIPRLDNMLGGEGFYRGTSILLSGTAGTGKSSIAASFALSACQRGERTIYFAFEESKNQIIRNMRSINIDLEPYVKKGLLIFQSSRPSAHGLEVHLSLIHKTIDEFKPSVTIFDPITNFFVIGTEAEIRSMITRTIDYLKMNLITALFTNLSHAGQSLEQTDTTVSSLMDTWLLLRDVEIGGERNRVMYVLKSRGMAHSNQLREFRISSSGIDLVDVYTGPSGVLTGSARASLEAEERKESILREQEIDRKKREIERKRELLNREIEVLKARFETEKDEIEKSIQEGELFEDRILKERKRMVEIRGATGSPSSSGHRRKARSK